MLDCSNSVHATYEDAYIHKHIAECLADDPSAVYHEKLNFVRNFKIAMIVLFWVICVLGIIPKTWPACRKNEYALSFLNCFSAGLFLAMAIVHMLPHSVGLYSVWTRKEGMEEAFPLPYLSFFCGFLMVLFIDRVLAGALGFQHTHDDEEMQKVMAQMEAKR